MISLARKSRAVLRLALAAVAAALIVFGLPSAASAAVRWSLTSEHAPQHLVPGQPAQFLIQAYNLGDTPTTTAYTVTDTLPAGVSATGFGGGWSCEGLPGPTVTCSHDGTSPPLWPPLNSAFQRGAAAPLTLDVLVSSGAAGIDQNQVTIAGGGTGALPGTDLDETVFSPTQPGFGFVPQRLLADFFDSSSPQASPVRQAGSHPYELRVDFASNLALAEDADAAQLYSEPDQRIKTLETRLPLGAFGDPLATPRCPAALLDFGGPSNDGACPANTQVGSIDLLLQSGKGITETNGNTDLPVYNMVPPDGSAAAFGFQFNGIPIEILATLDPSDYSVVAKMRYLNDAYAIRSAHLTMWGVPADPAHNPLRLDPGAPADEAFGASVAGTPIRPFLTLPSHCGNEAGIALRAESWEEPGRLASIQAPPLTVTGCQDPRERFEPQIAIQPTSAEAAAPTGLDVDLSLPQQGENAESAAALYGESGSEEALATPPLRDAITHLPPGMAINPAAADGLAGCSEAQVGLGTNDPPSCPPGSKLGTVEIESPLVPDPLRGFIYQARQDENPTHSLLGFYTVAAGDGLSIKLAAEVAADPQTGDLTTVYRDNPQLSFTHYRLHFWGGQRAPLINPPACGTYTGSGTFTSWNQTLPAVTSTDATHITSGPGGGPCPNGGFAPSFHGGAANPLAGAFSPFGLEVSRADGSQGLRTIAATLPPGSLARLADVPYCADSVLAAIPTAPGTGAGERANPSCPAASLVGHLDAGAGAGLPFHTPGNVYLAGPYRGAPLSLAVVTPLIGGPLDLGNVLTRVALHIDPTTAQVRALSDPLPGIIAGIPLDLRSVRIDLDRPQFSLNPTSCEPASVTATIGGLAGASAALADRFQLGGCGDLAFRPRLSLRLKGANRRAGHPALRATLTMAKGREANIARASVSLPHSELVAQSHLVNICTRVQFAAAGGGGAGCPERSVYGHATAWSPLLDQPLSGPVYLRSSSHQLPDLVASLSGQIHIDLVGRVGSNPKTEGLLISFAAVPDAPVSKFVLRMPSGRHSLLENSTNLCVGRRHAAVSFRAHNGRTAKSRVAIAVAGCRHGRRPGGTRSHR